MRSIAAFLIAAVLLCACFCGAAAAHGPRSPLYAVGYDSGRALAAAVAGRGDVVRRLRALRVAEVRTGFAAQLRRSPGIRFVQLTRARASTVEPALLTPTGFATPSCSGAVPLQLWPHTTRCGCVRSYSSNASDFPPPSAPASRGAPTGS